MSCWLVTSSTYSRTRQLQGSLYEFRNVQKLTSPTSVQSIYTARSLTGHTQLSACATGKNPKTGVSYIYITGGTTGILFDNGAKNSTTGALQAFVVRLSSDGKVLAGVQFASNGRSEYGASINMNQDTNELLVTVNSESADQLTSKALLFRLNPLNLSEVSSRTGVTDYGGSSHIVGQSMAVSPAFNSSTQTSAIFVAGSANIIPNQFTDIFCHIHARVGTQQQSVAVYGMNS
jgi:hypothetical protein